MFGIENYEPIFFSDKDEFIKNHGEKLRLLIGSTFEELVTVHEADGEFWGDCPVILVIGGKQVEFCSFKQDISVTWNEIDVSKKVDWYGSSDLFLKWQKNMINNVSMLIGKKIDEIEMVEATPGFLYGIGFRLGTDYFTIFNAHDETGFSLVRDADLIYTKL